LQVNTLSPNWVTGFSDGDSSFSVAVFKSSNHKTGWSIIPYFAIELKERDLPLLLKIQTFFGIGRIHYIKNKGHVVYVVNSIKDIHSVIIPHFMKYPLLTQKRVSFLKTS